MNKHNKLQHFGNLFIGFGIKTEGPQKSEPKSVEEEEKIRGIPRKRTRIWIACETDQVGPPKNPQPLSSASSSSESFPSLNSSAEPSSHQKETKTNSDSWETQSETNRSHWVNLQRVSRKGKGNLRRRRKDRFAKLQSGFSLFFFVEEVTATLSFNSVEEEAISPRFKLIQLFQTANPIYLIAPTPNLPRQPPFQSIRTPHSHFLSFFSFFPFLAQLLQVVELGKTLLNR